MVFSYPKTPLVRDRLEAVAFPRSAQRLVLHLPAAFTSAAGGARRGPGRRAAGPMYEPGLARFSAAPPEPPCARPAPGGAAAGAAPSLRGPAEAGM